MRILLQLPNWLGDAVMATPALNNCLHHFRGSEFTLIGSPVVADLFADDRRFGAVYADTTKKTRFRMGGLWKLGRKLRKERGPFDLAISWQNNAAARWLMWSAGAVERVSRRKHPVADLLLTHAVACEPQQHHACIHNEVLNGFLGTDYVCGKTTLPSLGRHQYARPTVGLHPGAAYGSAKRWEPQRFAEAAVRLAQRYDIALFGAPHEKEITAAIESQLQTAGVTNVTNFTGQTTVRELAARIAGLELFIANDSGPMHVAGALNTPTIAVFGSTDHTQTKPWAAELCSVVRLDLECSPCHARHCPLGHHKCMADLTADHVLAAADALLARRSLAAAG